MPRPRTHARTLRHSADTQQALRHSATQSTRARKAGIRHSATQSTHTLSDTQQALRHSARTQTLSDCSGGH
eukprot:4691881-Alexandrium_andersonii.AAC.1